MSLADVPPEFLASRKEYVTTKLAPILAVLSHEVVDRWPEDAARGILARLCAWHVVPSRFERAEARQNALLKELEALRGPGDASMTPRGAKRFSTMAQPRAAAGSGARASTRASTEGGVLHGTASLSSDLSAPRKSMATAMQAEDPLEPPKDRRVEYTSGVEKIQGELRAEDEDVVYGPADPADVAALQRALPDLVSEQQQRRILARGERFAVPPRTRVVSQDDETGRGYLVISGTLLAFVGSKCVASIRKGGCFGGVWKDSTTEPVTIEAVDECLLVSTTAQELQTARYNQQLEDEAAARAEDLAVDGVPKYAKSLEQELRIRNLLKACPFFRGVPETTMEQVQGAFREAHVAPRTVIFSQGAAPDFFYLVEYGTIIFLRSDGGKEQCIGTATGAGYFGELGVIRGDGRCAGAESADEAVLWKLEKAVFACILQEFVETRRARGIEVLDAAAGSTPAIAELSEYERALLADLLVPKALPDKAEHTVESGQLLFVATGEAEGPLGQWAWGQEHKVGACVGDARGLEADGAALETLPVSVRGSGDAEMFLLDMTEARRILGREY